MTIKSIIWGFVLCFTVSTQASLAATTTRVSLSSLGQEGNDGSCCEAISKDGRFVAFQSDASNLVAKDTNDSSDIFVHDRWTGETTRVSINSQGKQGNGPSEGVAISGDGRFVAFASRADNLVANDNNGDSDIFLHDRKSGKTTRVSISSLGREGNDRSWDPAISGDGRIVAFASRADNLVANDTNGEGDIFVHDRKTDETTRVSVDSEGQQANERSGTIAGAGGIGISGNGQFVGFESRASNLVAADRNGEPDIFVHDRKTGKTTRVSVDSRGRQGNNTSEGPNLSWDGRFVGFGSEATNLVADDTNESDDAFIHDRKTGKTTRVSVDNQGQQGNGNCGVADLSGDGRFVVFGGDASNLVADDTNGFEDLFMHDRRTGETTRINVNSLGQQANGGGGGGAISGDGRFVAFHSEASNLVPGDSNGDDENEEKGRDSFVFDRNRDIVNGLVTFKPKSNTFRMTSEDKRCGDAFERRFRFVVRLENEGDADLKKLHVPLNRLTGGNNLATEWGRIGPNGEFPVPERDDYADGILGPGESVTVPLEVCLRDRDPFKLYVDIADDRRAKPIDLAGPQAEFRFIIGLDGDDILKGTNGDDTLIGFDGDDMIRGNGGNDLILGGAGDDDLRGGEGDDEIRGGDGQDTLRGKRGDDLIFGGRGDDDLHGHSGDDDLRGNSGNDRLLGGGDNDMLKGHAGNDTLDGGRGVDICKGSSGTDTLGNCEL